MKIEDLKILVVGDRVWGIGDDLTSALKQMRIIGESRYYVAYIAHPATRVDDMGYIAHPSGYAPKEIHRVAPSTHKRKK